MFCPACGNKSTPGLKYCQRCGASFGASADSIPAKFPLGLTSMFLFLIGVITIVGLVVPLVSTEELTKTFSTHDMLIILFGSWILTLLVDSMLVWLLFMMIGMSQRFVGNVQQERSLPEDRIPEGLAAAPQPIGSVTENTTRSFKLAGYSKPSE